MKLELLAALASLTIVSTALSTPDQTAESAKTTTAPHFEGSIESLKQYHCPDWFRDAKFGIYAHWNAQSVPAADGWYARTMYCEGSPAYKYHVKHYGHPSKFGYKDIIPLWKGEKFDADAWVQLYKDAGVKYVVCMAVHHDNFDLWDSKYQKKWNSVNMGPKKDIVGLMEKATRKQGLRFGVTTHLARSYSWFSTNKGADKTGPLKGVPYDGNDPKYADLYFAKPKNPVTDWVYPPSSPHRAKEKGIKTDWVYPLNAPADVRENWLARMKDLIDKYHPDHFYLDGAIPFQGDDEFKTGLDLLAHYYNDSVKRYGKMDSVMFIKDKTRKQYRKYSHGLYVEGVASLDIERDRSAGILKAPWQTDATMADDWFMSQNPVYQSAATTVYLLVDIVSKNGNLLLNVPPRADGSFHPDAIQKLKKVGAWLKINGDAIYGTRPWLVSCEGPSTQIKHKDDSLNEVKYTAEDIRYTKKETANGTCVYATTLGLPKAGTKIILHSFSKAGVGADTQIKSIQLLGAEEPVTWKRTDAGLEITMPEKAPNPIAVSFKLKLK